MKRSVWICLISVLLAAVLTGCVKTNVFLAPSETAAPTATSTAVESPTPPAPVPTATAAPTPATTPEPTPAPTPAPTPSPAPPTPAVSDPNADVLGLWKSSDGTSTVEFFSNGTATIINSGEAMSGGFTYDHSALSGRVTVPDGYWMFNLSPDKSTLYSIIKEYHRS